jgi:hypothetical protein
MMVTKPTGICLLETIQLTIINKYILFNIYETKPVDYTE